MTSFRVRRDSDDTAHSQVSIFVGPDPDHRAFSGTLILRKHEADELEQRLNDPVITYTSVGGDQ